MKIFKVSYEASVGAAYIKAKNLDDAIEKLGDTAFPQSTKDVRFDRWEPELFDLDKDNIEELAGDEEKNAQEIMFWDKAAA